MAYRLDIDTDLSLFECGGVEVQLHCSWPRHSTEVSAQIHDPASLPPGIEPPVPLTVLFSVYKATILI
jgi:hypothetical protein